MKRYFSFLFIIFFIVCIYASSCKINPDSNRNYADKSKVYKLYLNPAGGSKYYFDITNESDLQMEVYDKKINSINKTNIGMNYGIDKDSSGNILLTTRYDKLHIYSKNGDDETDLNADNAKATLNPAEELLGYLKEATITASVDPTGEIKNISGYKEIGDKIMASF